VSKGRWAVPGYKASLSRWRDDVRMCTNNRTGEVRRSVRPLSVSFFIAKTCPIWVVLPHIVNSSRNASIEFDVHHYMPCRDIAFHPSLKVSVSLHTDAVLNLDVCYSTCNITPGACVQIEPP
jgi:hypothetical protein